MYILNAGGHGSWRRWCNQPSLWALFSLCLYQVMLQIRNILVDIILCGPYLVDIIYLSRDVLEKAKGSTALLCPLCRAPMYGPAPPFYCKPVTNDAVRFIVDCRFIVAWYTAICHYSIMNLIWLLVLWSGHPQGCWLSPSSFLQSLKKCYQAV